MALGTTNISLSAVKSVLGETTYSLFGICTSSLINKWSKYKPIRDAGGGTNWPSCSDGKYGFDLIAGSNPDKWEYLQPRGGSPGGSPDEPGRLGDFRGYEHSKLNAFPTIQCRDTDNNVIYRYKHASQAVLYPSSTPYMNAWTIRLFRSASSVLILPSDLGYDNYYIGLKFAFGGATWYKTFSQIKDYLSDGSSNISISTELVDWSGSPTYSNFPGDPMTAAGEADWQLFISENPTTAAGPPAGWQNGLTGNIIYFPEDTDGTNTFESSGSFIVHDWIKLSEDSMIFDDLGTPYQSSIVYCSSDSTPPYSITSDSWINAPVYDGGVLIANPMLYLAGMEIRVTCDPLTTDCIVTPTVGDEDWSLDAGETDGSLVGHAERDGVVTVTSEGEDAVINVSQGNAGSDQLWFQFRSVDLSPGGVDVDVRITRGETEVYNHVYGDSDTDDYTTHILGRDGYTLEYTVTIHETGVAGETYVVTLTRH